jgi:hypothetical protein
MRMEAVGVGSPRRDNDGVRRYRPVEMSFDFRARFLSTEIGEDWKPSVRAQHLDGIRGMREGLIHEYDVANYEAKIQDFIDLDVAPLSVLSVHNRLLSQSRDAFVMGAYFTALVGVAALGERILNELILRLRDRYFADHPATKYVKGKKSVDDWSKAIKTLEEWGTFSTIVASRFGQLAKLRHRAVHYQLPQLHETGAREEALEAITQVQAIIEVLFPAIGSDDRFIPGTPGAAYLRLDAESDPLVREFFLPACVLVSPEHRYVEYARPNMQILDNVEFAQDYGVQDLGDAEFADWNPSSAADSA